ncbi:hypothetical protein Neosp_015183 [[Neocosmospora] mangrovei]
MRYRDGDPRHDLARGEDGLRDRALVGPRPQLRDRVHRRARPPAAPPLRDPARVGYPEHARLQGRVHDLKPLRCYARLHLHNRDPRDAQDQRSVDVYVQGRVYGRAYVDARAHQRLRHLVYDNGHGLGQPRVDQVDPLRVLAQAARRAPVRDASPGHVHGGRRGLVPQQHAPRTSGVHVPQEVLEEGQEDDHDRVVKNLETNKLAKRVEPIDENGNFSVCLTKDRDRDLIDATGDKTRETNQIVLKTILENRNQQANSVPGTNSD